MATTSFGSISPAPAVEVQGGGRLIGIGAALACLGFVASANLLLASIAVIYVVAAAMAAGGILMLAHAARVSRAGWVIFWSVSGLVYLAAAAAVLVDPLYAIGMLTVLLVPLFGGSGAIRIVSALAAHGHGWEWVAASGLCSIAFAVLIALGWPGNALWFLGLMLAVDLIVQGAMLMMVGFTLRERAAG